MDATSLTASQMFAGRRLRKSGVDAAFELLKLGELTC